MVSVGCREYREEVTSRFHAAAAVLIGIALPALSAASQLSVYLSAPSAVASTVTFSSGGGLTTETFDNKSGSYTTYTSTIGTYSGSMKVQAADAYGGASGTTYMTFGAQTSTSTPVTLTLKTPENYFGFYWSAGDANNGLSVYSAGTQLAHFTTADIKNLLSGPTVTAINGSTYQSSAYNCNPNNTSQDCGEPFAFVHLVATGFTFDKVVFDNSNTTGTGFESDNHTVAYGTVVLPGTFVTVESLQVTTTSQATTPEPGSVLLLLGGLAAVGYRRRAAKGRA